MELHALWSVFIPIARGPAKMAWAFIILDLLLYAAKASIKLEKVSVHQTVTFLYSQSSKRIQHVLSQTRDNAGHCFPVNIHRYIKHLQSWDRSGPNKRDFNTQTCV